MVWVLRWLSFFDHLLNIYFFEFLLIVRSMWNDSPMVYSQMILVGRIGKPGRSRRRESGRIAWCRGGGAWRPSRGFVGDCDLGWFGGCCWHLGRWTFFWSDWKHPGCFLESFFLVGRHVFFCLMWLEQVAKILRTNWANDRFKFNFMKGILLDT